MIEVLIIGATAGMLLGLRFKVFVLGPVMLLATMIIIGTGTASGRWPVAIALLVLEAVASLEIGYVAGVLLRAKVLAHLWSLDRRREPEILNGWTANPAL
jgi:H+/Cl- antiporter ClcA